MKYIGFDQLIYPNKSHLSIFVNKSLQMLIIQRHYIIVPDESMEKTLQTVALVVNMLFTSSLSIFFCHCISFNLNLIVSMLWQIFKYPLLDGGTPKEVNKTFSCNYSRIHCSTGLAVFSNGKRKQLIC